MEELLNYILTGLILGITAGVSPGPLMAVLISETMKGNIKNGLIISIIPVVTDIPLIFATVFMLKKFQNFPLLFNFLYVVGGLTLIYFGVKDLAVKKISLKYELSKFSSFKKGVITNLLNPHPYIFWIFIGVPFIIEGSVYQMVSFVFSFFSGIVGSKILIALTVEKGKSFLENEKYIYIVRISGIVLIIFGILLILKIG